MKNLLTVIGDGSDISVLETTVLIAQLFNSQITGMNGVSAEYAHNLGSEPAFSIHSDLSQDNVGQGRQDDARSRFRKSMIGHGVPLGLAVAGQPSAGRQSSLGFRAFERVRGPRDRVRAYAAYRNLYDRLATRTDFVRYDIQL
jgi:hypothetical protein